MEAEIVAPPCKVMTEADLLCLQISSAPEAVPAAPQAANGSSLTVNIIKATLLLWYRLPVVVIEINQLHLCPDKPPLPLLSVFINHLGTFSFQTKNQLISS